MKFLIAVGSEEYSGPTLRVGMEIADAFKASVTVLKVGPRISEYSASQVKLAQERMEEWDFDSPGVEVLEWAFNFLAENQYITPSTVETGFPKTTLIEKGKNRAEVYLQGTTGSDVSLILRNGDTISELRDEVSTGNFDVTIIGGSQKRRMAHDLIQYLDSSIFVVNQYDHNKSYRLLVAVNDSPHNAKAVKFGVRVSQAFDVDVDLVTVSKTGTFKSGYQRSAYQAEKLMRRMGIQYESHLLKGDPIDIIKKTAGDNHIIVMGSSTKNPLIKFFTGSKPLKIMEHCPCPVLIVK
ncbi:MAG: universal stress protein [Candidatus Marinimicrobia bacterium]|jgi:nucleotide-binding universal stress UspA family protein|nr:universal stress protein [Candidatus Neomarinimicrobiota bacterium]|tara:strand:+ start:1743 stop:2627 length:885 start_codon:yes stop_codon:yes gene_type:complete